jgi:hypothetical protein
MDLGSGADQLQIVASNVNDFLAKLYADNFPKSEFGCHDKRLAFPAPQLKEWLPAGECRSHG